MKRSNRLVLLIGIFLALVAFVLVLVTLRGNQPGSSGPTAPPTTVNVVIAVSNITLGSKISQADVTTKSFAIEDRPADSYTDPSLVIGQTVRQSVTAGQYISTAVINGTGGTLNNIEAPAGFVAIAVQVDQTTGVGTLIKPGDYVDVVTGITGPEKVPLVVFQPASPRPGASANPAFVNVAGNEYNPTTVKVLVQGLQVLGTLLPPPAAAAAQPAASGSTGGTGTSLNGQQEIVILAVTTQQAEAIKFSQMQGDVSLVLRATADCQSPDGTASPCPVVATTGITLRRLVDDFGVLPPQIVEVIEPTPYPSPKR